MKAIVKAPANIAFIKYWGKKNPNLNLPANSSISMNLSNAYTITSVEFSPKYKKDQVFIDNKKAKDKEYLKVSNHLKRVRDMSKVKDHAFVKSRNSFPKGAGIASSASGFAALTLAATKAVGLNLNMRELSILARLGSGSACRSIPDGFVEWKQGDSSKSSYAYSLFPSDHWKICDIVVIVGEKKKKVSSSQGHLLTETSLFYQARLNNLKTKIRETKRALKNKDFTLLGEIIEEEAINMHAVMLTSRPALFYWLPETLDVIFSVQEGRKKGLESYFTIDAGPNVHVICKEKDKERVKRKLKRIHGVKKTILNYPAKGASLI